jgi:hypothetical protein
VVDGGAVLDDDEVQSAAAAFAACRDADLVACGLLFFADFL